LRKRGHEVAIFTANLGALGYSLQRDGFDVVDTAASVPWVPDIIQANHTYPLVEAFACFPDVPVLCICHDASAWYNEPVALPTICKHSLGESAAELGDMLISHFGLVELQCVEGIDRPLGSAAPPVRTGLRVLDAWVSSTEPVGMTVSRTKPNWRLPL
jgi:hypothetical protein